MLSSFQRQKYLFAIAVFIIDSVCAVAENPAIVSWESDGNRQLRERLGVTEKSICRYLDLDGDGFDEVLFPHQQQIDPCDLRYTTYGIARKNPEGHWFPVMKAGSKKDCAENIEMLTVHYADSFVAFDLSCEKKRAFSLWNPVSGIYGFYILTESGLESYSRERLLRYLGVGEFPLLKGLKVVPEQSDRHCMNKLVALRLTEGGYVSVCISESSVISIYWTPDTCGAKHNAFPQALISLPVAFRDRIAGVIFHGKGEQRLGILFNENAGGIPNCCLYGTPGENLLEVNRFAKLEKHTFLEKTDKKILTEFFVDDGRVREGKTFPVIWFEQDQYGFQVVGQNNMF